MILDLPINAAVDEALAYGNNDRAASGVERGEAYRFIADEYRRLQPPDAKIKIKPEPPWGWEPGETVTFTTVDTLYQIATLAPLKHLQRQIQQYWSWAWLSSFTSDIGTPTSPNIITWDVYSPQLTLSPYDALLGTITDGYEEHYSTLFEAHQWQITQFGNINLLGTFEYWSGSINTVTPTVWGEETYLDPYYEMIGITPDGTYDILIGTPPV